MAQILFGQQKSAQWGFLLTDMEGALRTQQLPPPMVVSLWVPRIQEAPKVFSAPEMLSRDRTARLALGSHLFCWILRSACCSGESEYFSRQRVPSLGQGDTCSGGTRWLGKVQGWLWVGVVFGQSAGSCCSGNLRKSAGATDGL